MTTTNRIELLTHLVDNAKTQTIEGRQIVVDSCKQLYNLIEDDVFNAKQDWMLEGMYKDLCRGNFAEPDFAEQKKRVFHSTVSNYNKKIAPSLTN